MLCSDKTCMQKPERVMCALDGLIWGIHGIVTIFLCATKAFNFPMIVSLGINEYLYYFLSCDNKDGLVCSR
jgi:hypothetical protein